MISLSGSRSSEMYHLSDHCCWQGVMCWGWGLLIEVRRHILVYKFWVKICLFVYITHWGRMRHICVSNIIIIEIDNGLSPSRRQAIIKTNAGVLLIEQTVVKLYLDSNIFIEQNTIQNVVCKISVILSGPRYIDDVAPYITTWILLFSFRSLKCVSIIHWRRCNCLWWDGPSVFCGT